jgi:hypothetical protein
LERAIPSSEVHPTGRTPVRVDTDGPPSYGDAVDVHIRLLIPEITVQRIIQEAEQREMATADWLHAYIRLRLKEDFPIE